MIVNGGNLYVLNPIVGMYKNKQTAHGVSHGLAECGYDIRIKQTVVFKPSPFNGIGTIIVDDPDDLDGALSASGNFTLASAIEEFNMPHSLCGIVHDKSTWARKGLSVFNTVIEAGWKGFLTLELVYHGRSELIIPAGSGIAQVIFHRLEVPANYEGKYQNQPDRPVDPRFE